ncbi:unnamed protein product, partial [Linum tenue]
ALSLPPSVCDGNRVGLKWTVISSNYFLVVTEAWRGDVLCQGVCLFLMGDIGTEFTGEKGIAENLPGRREEEVMVWRRGLCGRICDGKKVIGMGSTSERDGCLQQHQKLRHIVTLLSQLRHFDHAPQNLRLPPATMVVARISLLIEMRFGAAEFLRRSFRYFPSLSMICALVHHVSNHNIDREHQVSDRGLSTPVPCICFCDYIHLPLELAVWSLVAETVHDRLVGGWNCCLAVRRIAMGCFCDCMENPSLRCSYCNWMGKKR